MDFSASTDMPEDCNLDKVIFPRPKGKFSKSPVIITNSPQHMPPISNKQRNQPLTSLKISYFKRNPMDFANARLVYQTKPAECIKNERITIEIPGDCGKQQLEVTKLFFFQNASILRGKNGESSQENWKNSTFYTDQNMSFDKRRQRDIKFTKRELIPQTRACNVNRMMTPNTRLGVRGLIKNIFQRKSTRSIT